MNIALKEIEKLLPSYLSGEVSDNTRLIIDNWRKESPENEAFYRESLQAWEGIPLLHEMEHFNSFKALTKVHRKLSKAEAKRWGFSIQRIAAILLLPLIVYAGYVTIRNRHLNRNQRERTVLQTVSSRQGMVSQFVLEDGTKIWLNSNSELQFPTHFDGEKRVVTLKGEAFFQVAKNEKKPFRVITKELSIDALGTSFNVMSYNDETQTEVVLVEGKVKLSAETDHTEKELAWMHPGERAVYEEKFQKVYTTEVRTDKYIAWFDGILMFRDDNMKDVAKQLSRWFNVEVILTDPEIMNYMYTATFRNENLIQVLDLLKLSAPIDYKISESKNPVNGNFSKQRVYLMKK